MFEKIKEMKDRSKKKITSATTTLREIDRKTDLYPVIIKHIRLNEEAPIDICDAEENDEALTFGAVSIVGAALATLGFWWVVSAVIILLP